MSYKNIIRKIILENEQDEVVISPSEFKELLKYVNDDVANILRLAQYRNKRIIIDGNLNLQYNRDIQNLNLISKINGNLDISYSNVDVFDEDKAKSISDWGSRRQIIRKQKELRKKLNYLDELRKEDAWNINNRKLISYQTEALYQYLEDKNYPQEIEEEDEMVLEDKYYIYPSNYNHYGGKSFTWLGEEGMENEYIVFDSRTIEQDAREAIESRIDELGYDAFANWVWEDHLDTDAVRDWLRWYIEESIYDSPQDYGLEEKLTKEQENYIRIYEEKMSKLQHRIDNEDLDEETENSLEEEVSDLEELIEDIKENPKGGFDENEIEEAIEMWVDDNEDEFLSYFKETGRDKSDILDYVDQGAVIDYIINHDSWGDIFGSYDNDHDELNVNGLDFIIIRYN